MKQTKPGAKEAPIIVTSRSVNGPLNPWLREDDAVKSPKGVMGQKSTALAVCPGSLKVA